MRITSSAALISLSMLLIGCSQSTPPVATGPETGRGTAITPSEAAPAIDRIDPHTVVTQADVEAVMGRTVDAPTMQSEFACIYRTLPQHYNVEVIVIPNSDPDGFQRSREAVAKVTAIESVEGIGD